MKRKNKTANSSFYAKTLISSPLREIETLGVNGMEIGEVLESRKHSSFQSLTCKLKKCKIF
jgi:hypothetical protein